MSSFIRDLYYSDLCGANKFLNLSDKGIFAANRRENIYNKLAGHIEKSDLTLLDEYIKNTDIVTSEELLHAYVSGMKDLIRLIASVFDMQ